MCQICRILACKQGFIHEQKGVLECEMIVNVEQTGWLASKNEAHQEDTARASRPTGRKMIDEGVDEDCV